MTLALWIINIVLALAFAATGTFKLVRTREQLQAAGMAWTESFGPGAIKAIGAAEIAGALGLILPLATGIVPVLAPLAAAGLAGTMLGATTVHARRKEPVAVTVVLAVVAVASAVVGFLVIAAG